MKTILSAVLISALMVSLALAGDMGNWFDMEKCEMCRTLMETKGLMAHTSWEHYNTSDGELSITRVDPEYFDSYKKAVTKMDGVAQRWMNGEKVYLCNMCKGMGAIIKAGASHDKVESGNTFISLTTSPDPEIVEQIHAWTDRTNTEMKAMAKGETPAHQY